MKLLLDTCTWSGARAALEEAGHDVIWAGDWPQDPGDDEILARAEQAGRVLVTLDKDFGELAFKSQLPAACGIILFRISASSPEHVANVAIAVLESRTDWAGHLAVIEDRRIRIVPLPTG